LDADDPERASRASVPNSSKKIWQYAANFSGRWSELSSPLGSPDTQNGGVPDIDFDGVFKDSQRSDSIASLGGRGELINSTFKQAISDAANPCKLSFIDLSYTVQVQTTERE
jgi:hypothetical protein